MTRVLVSVQRREHRGKGYSVALLELGDGSRLVAVPVRGEWRVLSSDGTGGWLHVGALVRAGVLRAVHRGAACYGHTDYILAVAP